MPSVSVDVDIDLEEFSTDELAEELYTRIQRKIASVGRDDSKLNNLLNLITALHDQFFGEEETDHVLPVQSLADELKSDYLQQVFEKYTLAQIESVLPI